MKNQRYKTSENWTHNLEKKALFQSEEKQRPPRYYSCEKQSESIKKPTKYRKASDHIEESKASLKCNGSMRGSRVRMAKPIT